MPDEIAAGTAGQGGTAVATPQAPAAPAAPAAPSPSYDWKTAGLDESTLALVEQRQWKNPADLATSYRNLEKLTGVPADQLVKLPKGNDPKEWDAVYGKLGRPESPDKYVVKVPDGDKGEFAGVAKQWFHKAGLSQSQVTQVSEAWNAHVAEQSKAAEAKAVQQEQVEVNALKQAWGAEYNTKEAIVQRAFDEFGLTESQMMALKKAAGPKAAMEFMYNIGSKLGVEDKTVPGIGGKGEGFSLTPEQASAKIVALKTDRAFIELFNSPDPKARMEAREQMDRLQKIAAPGFTTVSFGGKR